MAKYKSKKHLVLTDNEGRIYCSKCGRAGFESQQSAYGHLSQCKGYKAEVKKFKEVINDIQGNGDMTGINRPSPLTEEINAGVALSSSASIFNKEIPDEGLTEGLPRAYLGPTLGPASGPLSQGLPDHVRLEIAKLKASNEYLTKLAFNHNQHVHFQKPRQGFSGPQDMVTSTFGDLMENKTIRMIVYLGALAMLLNFVKDQFDKLDKRSKNRRN